MKLDRNVLRRIINEEAAKLGMNLNERVVGPSGRGADPVRFAWRPELRRWEAAGKIVEDAKDIAIDFAVNPEFAAGEFRCMSMIYQGKVIFKWVDADGNQVKAVNEAGERIHGLDSLLNKVNLAFLEYIGSLKTSNPVKFAEEQEHMSDHTPRELKPAAVGSTFAGAAPAQRRLVNPFEAPAAAPLRGPPPPLRRPGAGMPGVDPLERLRSKINAFVDASEYLVSLGSVAVDRTPDYDQAEADYARALADLQSLLGVPDGGE